LLTVIDKISVIFPGERQVSGCAHQENKKMKKTRRKARGRKATFAVWKGGVRRW